MWTSGDDGLGSTDDAKIESEILADPKDLRVVAHYALMLNLEHARTESKDVKTDAKTMGDKVKDMGDKLLDKVQK